MISSVTFSLLDKIACVPPLNTSDCGRYDVKARGLETTVEASSSFEAALKFAFLLARLNFLKDGPTPLKIRESNGNIYIYKAKETLVNNRLVPQVALESLEFYSHCFQAAQDDEIQDVEQLPKEIDLTTGELIQNTLHSYFGFGDFRPLQKETVGSTMCGDNVLTVLSTGGGKSLTFMLPAVLGSRPTIVICPIKALIGDQLARCAEVGISACQFTGDISLQEQNSQLRDIHSFKLIFLIPEIIEEGPVYDKLNNMLENNEIDRIVFDEAHTISTWGDTFRPVYKRVCEKMAKHSCTKLLLSATINHRIESQLKEIFGVLVVYRHSVFRENLFLEVVDRSGKLCDEIANYVKEKEGECGIVYAVLPSDVSKIHAELLKNGISCVKYHGQLSEKVKAASSNAWMNGSVNVIVANASFGMGIDRPDVRYVIHGRIQPSMDDYFQQVGRAGHDGSLAYCKLFYSYSDKTALYKLFSHQQGNFSCQQAALSDFIIFLEDPVKCRHKAILEYYGENKDNFVCISSCDNCKQRGVFQETDGTADAVKVVQSLVQLTDKTISCNTLKLFLSKSNQKVIRDNGLETFSTYGILDKKFVPVGLLERFLHLLIAEEILTDKVEKKGRSLSFSIALGPKAHDVLALNYYVRKYVKVK